MQGVEIETVGTVEKAGSAVAQLQHAKACKADARGTKGAARVAAMNKACQAYDAVVSYWPDSGVVTAEAAFRSGEINRTMGHIGVAKGRFEVSFDNGEGSTFASRALLEIGHIHRRESEMDKALEYYGRVAALKGAPIRYINDSREWAGKTHFELGHWEKSIVALEEWYKNAEGPIEQIKSVDLQVQCLINLQQPVKAQQMLDEVLENLSPLAEEPSKESAKLKRAIERMKAPKLLVETD